jgi:hypothetical protein
MLIADPAGHLPNLKKAPYEVTVDIYDDEAEMALVRRGNGFR